VKREAAATCVTFDTKADAIRSAREMVRHNSPSQLVIYDRSGRIRDTYTHGLPAVKAPPKGIHRSRIERAVSKVVRDRLESPGR
jgi:hypothetical protein